MSCWALFFTSSPNDSICATFYFIIPFLLQFKEASCMKSLGKSSVFPAHILESFVYLSLTPGGSTEWVQLCCGSVARSCPVLCSPMNCSMPGFRVLHHHSEIAQTRIHWVGDPRPSPFLPRSRGCGASPFMVATGMGSRMDWSGWKSQNKKLVITQLPAGQVSGI